MWGLFQIRTFASFVFLPAASKVELVLDLSFTAGHQGDTLASAWAVTDGKGEPIGPRMVLEVVHLGLHKNWEKLNLEMFFLLGGFGVNMSFFISEQYIYICPYIYIYLRASFQLGCEFWVWFDCSSCCRHIDINGGSYQNSQKWKPLRWI